MKEKELFEEIKPLIEEYKEYANQKTPDMWKDMLDDIKISDKSREEGKVYTANRELEIMQMLDVMDTRRKLVEELLEIRKTKMTEMRSTIFEKIGAFISDSKEKMNQDIQEKRQELEKQKEEKRLNFEKKQQELEEKQQLRREMNKRSKALVKYLRLIEQDLGKDDKVYMSVGEEKIKAFRDKENLIREINDLEKECEILKFEYEDFVIENDGGLQELENRLKEFDNTYGKINFESEDAIDYIGEMAESYKEENEIHRLTEDEVEVTIPDKIITMAELEQRKEEEKKAWEIYDEENIKQQEKWKEQQEVEWKKYNKKYENINKKIMLEQQLRKRLDEIEEGNKDLLVSSYFKFRDKVNEEEDIENVLKILEGKKILDIYEGLLAHMVDSPAKKELEDAISKLKERETGEKLTKGTEQKPTGEKPTKGAGQKPTEEKPAKGAGQKPTEKKSTTNSTVELVQGQMYKNGEPLQVKDMNLVFNMQEKQILKEELEQMLEELKVGNTDLVNSRYTLFEKNLKSNEDIEATLKFLAEKTMKNIYELILKEVETPEEQAEIKDIIEKLDIRENTNLYNFVEKYANIHIHYKLKNIDRELYSEETKQLMRSYIDDHGDKDKLDRVMECYKKVQVVQKMQVSTDEEEIKLNEELDSIYKEYNDVRYVVGYLLDEENHLLSTIEVNHEEEVSHEEILAEIEQEFLRIETGNEDLLHSIYYDYKENYQKECLIDYKYAKKILAYCKETTLSGFYKDNILGTISAEAQTSDEDMLLKYEIEDIIGKIKARDKHRNKYTTIEIKPDKDLIEISIEGREGKFRYKDLLRLIQDGNELQEGFISKFGINRCDPAILTVLTHISEKFPGHRNLVDEYINSFSVGTDKIDEIVYYFNEEEENEEENKPDNYKQIVKACKKYAKAGEKYGIAIIEGTYREGIWDKIVGLGSDGLERIQSFLRNRKQKRIENKEAKEYRLDRAERKTLNKRDSKTFMNRMKQKKNNKSEIDISEAIKKLESINQEMGTESIDEEELV